MRASRIKELLPQPEEAAEPRDVIDQDLPLANAVTSSTTLLRDLSTNRVFQQNRPTPAVGVDPMEPYCSVKRPLRSEAIVLALPREPVSEAANHRVGR